VEALISVRISGFAQGIGSAFERAIPQVPGLSPGCKLQSSLQNIPSMLACIGGCWCCPLCHYSPG